MSDAVEERSSWEYLLCETQPDPILQLAIAHLEREGRQPFRDGKGHLRTVSSGDAPLTCASRPRDAHALASREGW